MRRKRSWTWKTLGLPGPTHIRVNGREVKPFRPYRIWRKMLERAGVCNRKWVKKTQWYKYYTHVTVCKEWREFPAFWAWAKTHGYRDDLTLDRIDGALGYSPENCRWATRSEQSRNRHYSEAYKAAARRNLTKARAASRAKRAAQKEAQCAGS